MQRLTEREAPARSAGSTGPVADWNRCRQAQGQQDEAEAVYDGIRRSFFGQPEALAATIFHGDLIRRDRPREAVALYKRGLTQVSGAGDSYSNMWLPPDQFRSRLQTAVDDLAEQSVRRGLGSCRSADPALSHTVAVERQATIHEEWARQLEERASQEKPPQIEATEAEARNTGVRPAPCGGSWPSCDWRRGITWTIWPRRPTIFAAVTAIEQAVVVYRELLRQEPQQGEPEALVGLGESLLALGKPEEAVETAGPLPRDLSHGIRRPIAHGCSPSLALEEQGKLPEAKELLIDNLYRFSLAPQSSEWRDSLFALGTLLYRAGARAGEQEPAGGRRSAGAEARRPGWRCWNKAMRRSKRRFAR